MSSNIIELFEVTEEPLRKYDIKENNKRKKYYIMAEENIYDTNKCGIN